MIRMHRPILLSLVLLIFTGCTPDIDIDTPGRIIIQNLDTPGDVYEYYQIIPSQPALTEFPGSRLEVLRLVDPGDHPVLTFRIPINNMREFWIEQGDARTRVVDQQTGSPVELTLGGVDWCIQYSPGGKRIALVADLGLFITGPDGKADLVLKRSSQGYRSTTLGYGAGNAFSAIDCPVWLSDQDLIVSYLGGAFPSEITTQPFSGPGVISTMDSTAVIHIGSNGSSLRSLNPRWCIAKLSPDRRVAVVGTWSEGSGGISRGWFVEGCESSVYYLADVGFLITGKGAAPVPLNAQCEGVHGCEGFKFSADGTRLGYFEQHELPSRESEYFVSVWDVTRKTALGKFIFLAQAPPGALVWAPDASALAYNLWNGRSIFILTADGETVKLRTEIPFSLEVVGWIDE
jgi:hypothetical protein